MRERMTQRRNREPVVAKNIMAEIEELEAQIAGVDEELEADAAALAQEEKKIVQESTDVPLEVGDDQNEKAMDNWPVGDKEKVAARLVKMAKELMESDK
jgi:hypothetical protein